jgi:hypothetical protein
MLRLAPVPRCAATQPRGSRDYPNGIARYGERNRGIRLKVDDHISKPSNADALVALHGDRLARRQVPRLMDEGELTGAADANGVNMS